MADVHTKEVRSYNMSRIKGKDTKPEVLVRKFLHTHGFRYRLHVKDLPGKPDIVLPKFKTVIFVHGCFWHGHEGCRKSNLPETNRDWWGKKIDANKEHDLKAVNQLKNEGWKIITLWTCQLDAKNKLTTLNELLDCFK